MGKYEDLDKKIIELIDSGAVFFYQITGQIKDHDLRAVDRRLQAMRKKGLIHFKGASWGWRTGK